MNYLNHKVKPITNVSWKLIDSKGTVSPMRTFMCFSPLTYNAIPKTTKTIQVIHDLNLIPYSKEIIERWVKEISKLGFPVTVSFTQTSAHFLIDLEKYKFRPHLSSTLQLIRCLFEDKICYVVENYYNLVGEKSTLEERFEILQKAHANVDKMKFKDDNPYDLGANTNHMVTYAGNFNKPLLRKEFFKRVKKSDVGVYSDKRINLSGYWRNLTSGLNRAIVRTW